MSHGKLVWICEECSAIIEETDKQVADEDGEWGRPCKAHPRSKKPWRCEAYWQAYQAVRNNQPQG